MQILSHRGYWKSASEKNAVVAFKRSFDLGFGTETDVRDIDGELVISHDPAQRGAIPLKSFFELAGPSQLPLALNIKADGLADALKTVIQECGVTNYFVFDMSVPDMRPYRTLQLPYFTRLSEVEPTPAFFDDAAGVWLDAFDGTWFDGELLTRLLAADKKVCVVSPELHRREHLPTWQILRPFQHHEKLMLCTDMPEEAQTYFTETT